jgi:hypothetical protein
VIFEEGSKFLWASWEGQGGFGGVRCGLHKQKLQPRWGKPSKFNAANFMPHLAAQPRDQASENACKLRDVAECQSLI